jgi:uncharacterized NAD(P)/FAD-binding protein YdhS
VLALGNPRPAALAVAAPVANHPAYVTDPWSNELQFSRGQKILLIGTGLTAADVINAASADPQRTPTLHALSRHGSCRRVRPPFARTRSRATAMRCCSRHRRRCADSPRPCASSRAKQESAGGDWREAITFVRNMAPTIWQRLSERDRVRFMRHLRALWDTHRHRLPLQLIQRVDELRNQQRLHVHAGRLLQFAPREERIEVTWRPRGTQTERTKTFDRVVNCTGPDYAVARSTEPLWRSLVQCGLCVADSLGLGLRTGPRGAVIDADGWPGPHLFYVGPMLRADLWEATAAVSCAVMQSAWPRCWRTERD